MTGRVLHVSQSVNTGVAHCVGDWVREQRRSGWEVTVASPGGMLAERCLEEGASLEFWPATRQPGPSVIRETRALARIIERVDPDIVHLQCAKAGLVGRLVLRGSRPTVFSPHAWSYHAGGGALRQASLRWEQVAARWADAVVCVSASEYDRGVRDGIRANFVVLPNQVDLGDFGHVLAESRLQSRTALGVTTPGPLAVCVARLAVQKGQDVLLAAWPAVLAAFPDAQAVLVGHGPERDNLQDAAAALPNVRLVGLQSREATLRWMKGADVVVCPSRWEGMSLVPLEARVLHTPVVATEVDGIHEAFPDGQGVRIVPVGSVPDLAGAIIDALAGRVPPYQGMTDQGGPSSAERLVELYEGLLENRTMPR